MSFLGCMVHEVLQEFLVAHEVPTALKACSSFPCGVPKLGFSLRKHTYIHIYVYDKDPRGAFHIGNSYEGRLVCRFWMSVGACCQKGPGAFEGIHEAQGLASCMNLQL